MSAFHRAIVDDNLVMVVLPGIIHKKKEVVMQYVIKKGELSVSPVADWSAPAWRKAETLEVADYPWPDSGHRPVVHARLMYDQDTLAVMFHVEDRYVRAVARQFQDGVCRDSCVEFFVSPLPDSLEYFNFEVNCGGTMLLHHCPSPKDRAAGKSWIPVSDEDGAAIKMAHTMPKNVDPEITEPTIWTIEYHVPFSLFEKYAGNISHEKGDQWRANFYKCGDQTSHPHWGSWAPVNTEKPNFHVPECFQPIIFG